MNLKHEEMEDDKGEGNGGKNQEPRLDQEWVQILINLRMKYSQAFTRKRHSATEAWNCIFTEMRALGAPQYVTIDKIKKKWMNLIARYKQLKFSATGNMITWPYYDQIDRAYTRNPKLLEMRRPPFQRIDKKISSESDDETDLIRRQKFTKSLIQLRYQYKHLFTGKKYAAQRAWIIIQDKLPEGAHYTIDQLSKCWQNLIQRYRSLMESETDHTKITWLHFNSMHKIMTQRSHNENMANEHEHNIKKEIVPEPDDDTAETETIPENKMPGLQPQESENTQNLNISEIPIHIVQKRQILNKSEVNQMEENPENEITDDADKENQCEIPEPPKKKVRHRHTHRQHNNCTSVKKENTPVDDLIKYFIERDMKLDDQHNELMAMLQAIDNKLNP